MASDTQILARLMRRMKEGGNPLDPLIDAYLMQRDRSPNRLQTYEVDIVPRPRPHGRISPSVIAGCEKQGVFKFIGVPGRQQIDPDLEDIFDDGNWRHHRLQARALDMEKVLGKDKFQVLAIEENVEIPQLFIAGSLDLVARIHKKKWVIDYKGINLWGFKDLLEKDEPKVEHVRQLITYMAAKRIPRGMLYYENKNNQQRRIYVVEFDPDEWQEVKAWCVRVIMAMRRRELPDMHPDCQAGTYMYEKCPWSSWCFGNMDHAEQEEAAYNIFDAVEAHWEEGHDIAGTGS